jgi:iron complex outermembrane receptor protein
MNNRFSFFCLSAIFLIAGLSPFVFSQETISVDVSAEKIVDEVPLESSALTIITADEIVESGASSVVEILENVPGIMFRSPLAGPGSEQITMRGFGENSHGRVLVLVDGNRMNNPDMRSINWNAVSLMDIERIEILDGSASVQYGNYAVAGVINIITKKSGKTQTNINLSAGSFWNNKEAISHQRSTDWGRFSISAEHIGSEGYRDRSAYNITNTDLQGTIDFNDQLSLSLNGSFANIDYQMPGAIYEIDYEDDPQTALNWNDEAVENHVAAGAELEWFLSDSLEFNLPISYRGVFSKINMASWPSYDNRNTNSAEMHPSAYFNFDIQEMPLNLMVGIDFNYANSFLKSYTSIERNDSSSKKEINIFDTGYFLSARFDPLPQLSFNTGLRHNMFFVDFQEENNFYQAFVYEVGAAYKPIDPLNLYVKYSTLFRFPFSDEIVEAAYPSGSYVNENLDPENGFNIEGGTRFRFEKWIAVDANIYYMKLSDEIAWDMILNHNQNLDDTQRIGTNISLTSNPFDFLELQGSYSYVNAEFTNGKNEEKKIPTVSSHEVSGAVTFVLPWNIKIGVDANYRGDSYQSGDNANELPMLDDYFLLGASVSYTLSKSQYRLMILLQGKNLLDTTYSSFLSYGGYYPANGREFNLSIQYRF